MVSEWTRDDLPDHVVIRDVDYMHGDGTRSRVIDLTLDAVVEHLNAHHPKPDTDRWRRAHEIVEGERDQARRERDMWKEKCLDTYEALHQARAGRDEAVARAEAAEARTAPAVTRKDVYNVLVSRIPGEYDEMHVSRVNGAVDAVCALFGIEVAVDPVEELAGQIESVTRAAIRQVCDALATVAPTLDPLAVEQAMEVMSESRKIAAHILGQEDKR